MIPATALDRLIGSGKLVGSLSISDLGRALPVETMTVSEIAEVVVRLEEAGVSVAMDEELQASHHGKRASNYALPEKPAPSSAKSTDHARLEALATSIKATEAQTAAPRAQDMPKSRTPFIIAAAAILLVLFVVAWAFSAS